MTRKEAVRNRIGLLEVGRREATEIHILECRILQFGRYGIALG